MRVQGGIDACLQFCGAEYAGGLDLLAFGVQPLGAPSGPGRIGPGTLARQELSEIPDADFRPGLDLPFVDAVPTLHELGQMPARLIPAQQQGRLAGDAPRSPT